MKPIAEIVFKIFGYSVGLLILGVFILAMIGDWMRYINLQGARILVITIPAMLICAWAIGLKTTQGFKFWCIGIIAVSIIATIYGVSG